MKIEIDIPDNELRHCVSCGSGKMVLTLDVSETNNGYDITSVVSDTYDGNASLKYREVKEPEGEFHCGAEESGWHAYNCNDCPNKCEEWYQWDKEFNNKKERCHEETIIESAPHAIQRIRDEIFEAKKEA